MLDFGWSELFIIVVVALIVVGPKEFPTLLRTIGKLVAVTRSHVHKLRSHLNDAIKQAGFEEIHNEMQQLNSDVVATAREAQRQLDKRPIEFVSSENDATSDQKKKNTNHIQSYNEDNWDYKSWVQNHNKSILETEGRVRAESSDSSVASNNLVSANNSDMKMVENKVQIGTNHSKKDSTGKKEAST